MKRSSNSGNEDGPSKKRLPDKTKQRQCKVLAKENAELKKQLQSKDKELKTRQGMAKQIAERGKIMTDLIRTLKRTQHGEEKEILLKENDQLTEDLQEEKELVEKKEEELKTLNRMLEEQKTLVEGKEMELAIIKSKKDKALKKRKQEFEELEQKKTKMEEQLKCYMKMLVAGLTLHQQQEEMVKKKEGEIVSLHGKMEKQTKLTEEEKKKLTEMKKEMEKMKTQITEKDKALTEKGNALKRENGKLENINKALKQQQREYKVLEQEKTKLEKELDEEERRHQEQKEMVKKKEGELVSLQGKMKKQTKLTEEEKKKLTEMKKEMEKMKTQLMEKDKKMITLQKNQHKVEKLLEHVEGVVRTVRHFNAGGEGLQEINKSSNAEEDIKKILMTKPSGVELGNEATVQQALGEIKKQIEKNGECSICKGLIIKATTLNCSHTFCAFCIQKWLKLKKDSRCPHCRKEVKHFAPCIALDNFIEGILDKLGDEIKQRREEAVKEREREMQEEGQLYSDSEYSSQSDDDVSSGTSPSLRWEHIPINAPFRPYRPSPLVRQ